MSDFQTLRNNVLDELDRAGSLTAQADTQINAAIKHYQSRRFWFNEERATATTTSGTEYYQLPSDYLDVDNLTITVNNWTYPLIRRHYKTMDDWYLSSSSYTGYPQDFAVYDQQFRLYPIPNGTYTLNLSYLKKTATLTNDSDTNAWTGDAEELIRSRACSQMCARILQDVERAKIFRVMEDDAYARLKSESARRTMTGSSRRS